MAHVQPPRNLDTYEPQSEAQVYRALRDQLSDGYQVIHSQNLSYLDGRLHDTEIDFVVWHPQHGILTLEVKGGRAIQRKKDGTWWTLPRGKDTWKQLKKSPFVQAQQGLHALKDILQERLNTPSLAFPYTYACVFPGAEINMEQFPIGIPESRCIDASVVRNGLAGAVRGALDAMDTHASEPKQRHDQLAETWDILTRVFYMRPSTEVAEATLKSSTAQQSAQNDAPESLADAIEEEQEIFWQLTEEQAELFFGALQSNRRVLVYGLAGTGKTFLALNRAKELAESGHATLMLCYNTLLAQHLQKQIEQKREKDDRLRNLEVRSFHEIIKRNIIHTSLGQWPTNPPPEFWIEDSADLLFEIIANKEIQYDALVVDEAQDIYPQWWERLELLLADDPYLYVFADRHQNIFGPQLSVKDVWPDITTFPLRRNCRSTRHVAEYAAERRNISDLQHHTNIVDGDAVEERTYQSNEEQQQTLDKLIRSLRQEEGVPADQIVLLSFHRKKNTGLAGVDRLGGYELKPFTLDKAAAPQELYYSTSQRFKGLDAPIVIVHSMEPDDEYATDPNHLYVACTRATNRLYLVHHNDWTPPESPTPIGNGAVG